MDEELTLCRFNTGKFNQTLLSFEGGVFDISWDFERSHYRLEKGCQFRQGVLQLNENSTNHLHTRIHCYVLITVLQWMDEGD